MTPSEAIDLAERMALMMGKPYAIVALPDGLRVWPLNKRGKRTPLEVVRP